MKTKTKLLAALAALIIVGSAYAIGAGTALVPRTASAVPILFNEDAVTAIYDSASPAVVEIRVIEQGAGLRGRFTQEGQGSGFLVDTEGHILTNNHVVDGASSVQVVLKGGKTVDASVAGKDSVDDLAVIKVAPSAVAGTAPLQLADSKAVRPGQMAIALGSPFGLDGSITVGIISGLDRQISGGPVGMLQTDAAINHGNSGGPLLNSSGQVIGVNTAIEPGARGIGFAVPSNVARKVLSDLVAGKRVAHPWLGIRGLDLTQAQAKSLGLSVEQGVYVISVVPDSPAAEVGLKGSGTTDSGQPAPGADVITAVDGKAVSSTSDLVSYFNTKSVGDSVVLTVLRGGQSLSVTVTLEARPDQTPVAPTPRGRPRHPGFPRD